MEFRRRLRGGLNKSTIYVFLVMCAITPLATAQDCYLSFTIDGEQANGVGNQVFVNKDSISETTAPGEQLYVLAWAEGGTPGDIQSSGDFTEYFEFDGTEANQWKAKVKQSLEGVPDYPGYENELRASVKFTGFSGECEVVFKHTLVDQNNKIPTFGESAYTLDIREDFPIDFDITDLVIQASDEDGTTPNKEFQVTVEGAYCPLVPSKSSYTGMDASVVLRLTEELDFEQTETFECTLRAEDKGTEPQSSTASLTVNVINRPDEPPKFEHLFYYSTVTSSTVGEDLVVEPKEITAVVEGSGVTYTMKNARADIDGMKYFEIDPITAKVSIKSDLENSILEEERVSFILEATDSTGTTGMSVLEVTLPPVPTTTPLPTTTPTTTPPPPTTTPTEMTCPACTCPTTESTTPWATSTPGTCPPCTTEVSTCEPCTPCPSTTTGESTECPTCAPSTLSTWLSTIASASSCPPCPTTESPGTSVTPITTCPECPTETPTTCPTTCPECPTETPTTCPECPTTCPTLGTPTPCPDCPTTCSPTVSPTSCPECPTTCPSTETPTTCPECPTTCPSTETPTTCPECPTTCPSTETPITCPECPTTCPSTELPTTCPECPTTCPSIETPTTCPTCPDCPTTCPSTETPTSCPECPTTCPSVTCPECPTTCPTCPTSCPTTTEGPPPPTLTFKKVSYAGEIFLDSTDVWAVEVVQDYDDVVYAWEGGDNPYFNIDPESGVISVKADNLEVKTYHLTAVATSGELMDEAKVLIRVVEPVCIEDDVVIKTNLIKVNVDEGSEARDLQVVETIGNVQSMCITDMQPEDAKDYFDVAKEGGVWKLKATGEIDFEVVKEATFKIKASKDAECSSSGYDDQLLRNEASVVVTINDLNDVIPSFVVPALSEEIVAYPQDISLQKVVGPVITLQAEDVDSSLTYSIDYEGEGLVIDEESGALYLQEENSCDQRCEVTVQASDGKHDTSAVITILSLDMDHIYSMTLKDVDVASVDEELKNISDRAGVKISKLYVTPEVKDETRDLRQKPVGRGPPQRDASWELTVHIYAVDGESLMGLGDLNDKLTEVEEDLTADSFKDKETFAPQPEEADVVGYQVAVGILGALLGLILVGAVGFFVYRWRQERGGRYEEPKKISTVGGAYPNLSFTSEEDKTDSPQGRHNGSLRGGGVGGVESGVGGFNVEDRRDSPPLFVSPLSKAEPPRSNSSKAEQARGLRRVDAGQPEYYGLSSPAPPPSFQSTSSSSKAYPDLTSNTTTTSTPSSTISSSKAYPDLFSSTSTSSSSSSKPGSSTMYPSLASSSYQPAKVEKKAPPPTSATPAKSILRGAAPGGTQDQVPMAVFSTEKDSEESATEYESVATSKFTALKGSPPPKRATHEDSEEEDRKEEGNDDDEERRKSVAFKIMVDTKEFVAENEGPSQKKASAKSDALDILEANKKKMSEAGDESEDEDVDEKF